MPFKTEFIDKVFEELVTKENKKNLAEVFPFEYKGEKYWVKKARATKSNVFHKIFYKISSIDLLVPVEDKNAKDAMLFEVNKIKKFTQEGILTSSVVGVGNDFFVMSNAGTPIYKLLKKSKTEEELYEYIDKIILLLSSIHSKGLFHGGAQSRNFTYLNQKVGVIDFEDSFKNSVSLETLQLRDLILLLLSMSKLKNFNVDYNYIVNKYVEETKNIIIIGKLKKLVKTFDFFVKICESKIVKRFLPRDVDGFIHLIKNLNSL